MMVNVQNFVILIYHYHELIDVIHMETLEKLFAE
jgi:hypothetical protein